MIPDPKMAAFLDLIAWSEGTSTSPITQDRGYDVIVNGIDGAHRMSDYDDHPFAPQYGRAPVRFGHATGDVSTAAGRYQLLYKYWRAYKSQLALPDFSPASQDRIALQQISERHARLDIENGNTADAVSKCSAIWASFPGNNYRQGGKSVGELKEKYNELLAARLSR